MTTAVKTILKLLAELAATASLDPVLPFLPKITSHRSAIIGIRIDSICRVQGQRFSQWKIPVRVKLAGALE